MQILTSRSRNGCSASETTYDECGMREQINVYGRGREIFILFCTTDTEHNEEESAEIGKNSIKSDRARDRGRNGGENDKQ